MSIYSRIEELFKERYKDWDGNTQFDGSGERLERLIDELCWTSERIDEEVKNCFKAVFPEPYNEMLVEGPISAYTLCPHHLLPCHFKVHIGYIPDGFVLGLSKFSRLAVIIGKRPIMQEQYSRELADVIFDNLKPKGVGVYVAGKHGCMEVRGIMQQGTDVKTSILKGCFIEAPVREEFFRLVSND